MIKLFLLFMALINTEQGSPFAAYQWQYRILVINAKVLGADQQLTEVLAQSEGLKDRDLLVFLKKGKQLICQNAEEKILEDSRNEYAGTSLIGKDGGVKMREGNAVEIQVIFDLIDSMPMRQSEIRRKTN